MAGVCAGKAASGRAAASGLSGYSMGARGNATEVEMRAWSSYYRRVRRGEEELRVLSKEGQSVAISKFLWPDDESKQEWIAHASSWLSPYPGMAF